MRYLIFLLLASCGGAAPASAPPVGPPASGAVYVYASDDLAPGRLAEYRNVGPDAHILVRPSILANTTVAQRTIAHELGHAIGLQHTEDTACRMLDGANLNSPDLCPAEVAWAQTRTYTLTVYGNVAGLSSACAQWNVAAGRALFWGQ